MLDEPAVAPLETSGERREAEGGQSHFAPRTEQNWDSPRRSHVQAEEVLVERRALAGFFGGEAFDLVAELVDLVFLAAELLHVAFVEVAGAVQLAHVLANAVLLLGDRLDLLFRLAPLVADLGQGLLALHDFAQPLFTAALTADWLR